VESTLHCTALHCTALHCTARPLTPVLEPPAKSDQEKRGSLSQHAGLSMLRPAEYGGLSMVCSAWWSQHGGLSMLVSACWYQHTVLRMVCLAWWSQHGGLSTVGMVGSAWWSQHSGLSMVGSTWCDQHGGLGTVGLAWWSLHLLLDYVFPSWVECTYNNLAPAYLSEYRLRGHHGHFYRTFGFASLWPSLIQVRVTAIIKDKCPIAMYSLQYCPFKFPSIYLGGSRQCYS
jgi:hypothetical protein